MKKTLYPCLILLIISYIIPITSEGLKITLIPPHSPESPAYLGNLTMSKKIEKLISQSRGRAQILSSSLFPTGILNNSSAYNDCKDINTTVERINLGGDSGVVYVAKIAIGTFPGEPKYATYYLILDTGSRLTWLQCAQCQEAGNTCFPQVDPFFRTSLSYSFWPIMENSTMCKSAPPIPNPRLPCNYTLTYAGGAKSNGIMAKENFIIESDSNINYSTLIFGCGFNQTGFPVKPDEFQKAAGIMGLGRGKEALHVQLDDSHVGLSFSYCFQDLLNQGGGPQRPTYLRFFEDMPEDSSTYEETTFQEPDSPMYFVRLFIIKIDNIFISRDPLDRVVMDSGSSVTHLVRPVYNSIRETLLYWLNIKGFSTPEIRESIGDHPSFCMSKVSGLEFDTLPSIHLILEGGGDFEIKPKQGFILWKEYVSFPILYKEYFCLMIYPHDTLNIIGAFQQVNHTVIYNTKQNKLFFKNEDCANS